MGRAGAGKDDESRGQARRTRDCFLFGLSARFGMASAQVKALLDSTGGLLKRAAWRAPHSARRQARRRLLLHGAPRTAARETTAPRPTQLAHHGMVFVPLGYSTPKLSRPVRPPRRLALRCGHAGRPRRLAPAVRAEKDIAEAHGATGTIAAKLAK